jgi:hypothetical protein
MQYKPTRYFPANSQEMKSDHGVVYVYENSRGLPAAIAYKGKAYKPVWHYSFRDPEQMMVKIDAFFAAAKAWEESKAKRRKERLEYQHTLQVGDVLYSSWGYDQTNINFYQVTRLVGKKMVELMEIAGHSGGEDSFMSAETEPVKDSFITSWRTPKPIVRKVKEGNAVWIDNNHVELATPV